MDFDESLPSHSSFYTNFYEESENINTGSTRLPSTSHLSFISNEKTKVETRLNQEIISFDTYNSYNDMDENFIRENDENVSRNNSPTKRPFLRKGSRKEPSALNKAASPRHESNSNETMLLTPDEGSFKENNTFFGGKIVSKISTNINKSENGRKPTNSVRQDSIHLNNDNQLSSRMAKQHHSSSQPGPDRESLSSAPSTKPLTYNAIARRSNQTLQEDEGEVLLDGTDYWKFDSHSLRSSAGAGCDAPPASKHTALASTATRLDSAAKELDEFARLEMQLENMSVDESIGEGWGRRPASSVSRGEQRHTAASGFGSVPPSQPPPAASSPEIPPQSYLQSFSRRSGGRLQAQRSPSPPPSTSSSSQSASGSLSRATTRQQLSTSVSTVDDACSWDDRPPAREPPGPPVPANDPSGPVVRTRPRLAGRPQPQSGRSVSRGSAQPTAPPPPSAAAAEELASKAALLESELHAVQQQAASVRRQQQTAVAEIARERQQLSQWATEERAKTEAWCAEQRQAIAKEKRAFTKQCRDLRQAPNSSAPPSVRSSKAEIDALAATVEKMKIDSAEHSKKFRTTEQRLQNLVKEQQGRIDEQAKQLSAMAAEKLAVWGYLDQLSVKLPAALSRMRPASPPRRQSLARSVSSEVAVSELPSSAKVLRAAPVLSELSVGSVVSVPPAAQPAALDDSRRLTRYRNGTVKEEFPDGSAAVLFANGDSKRTSADGGTVVYFYATAQTTHTTYGDGLEVYEFPNRQVEKHFPGGRKEILFPDGTRKVVAPDGSEENYFPDGTVVRELSNGLREVLPPDP